MKTKFILLATALFCLASCNNAEFDNNVVDLGGSSYVSPSGDVYTIEIEGSDPLTKGNVTTQSLGIANLSDIYSKSPTAQLLKNKEPVSGASYTWSLINSGGSYISLDNASSQQAILTAVKVKSQANLLHVKGTDGVGSAEIDVPVVVADNFNIDWSESSITLSSGGDAQLNTVITNAKEKSVKIICPSNCKIGTSKSSLGTSDITVNTGDDGKIPVYVQYTGFSNTTLNLQAASGNHSAESSINTKEPAPSSITLEIKGANSIVIGDNSSYKVTAFYRDGSTKDVTSEATIISTNKVGLSCSGGVISTSKIDGCLGKRSLTASYGGKESSPVEFTVTTDFDYLKFNLNSESDVFSDIRDYAINTKYTQYGLQLHSETGARSGSITFRIRNFYLFIKGSTDPYQGNHSYKMNDSSVRDDFRISVTCGESYTLHIYYLGEEVFSQRITIVTN